MAVFHSVNGPVEIPSLVEDADGEMIKVDSFEDLTTLICAMGFDNLFEFESLTGVEAEKLLRRWWYYGNRDRIYVPEQDEAINEDTAGRNGIERIKDAMRTVSRGEPTGVQLYAVAEYTAWFLATLAEKGMPISVEGYATVLKKILSGEARDDSNPDFSRKH
jgi:hypothetical protein